MNKTAKARNFIRRVLRAMSQYNYQGVDASILYDILDILEEEEEE